MKLRAGCFVRKKLTPNIRYSPLGKYLLAAARVVDEMDYEADERLLRDNLNADPPLHIRRTLDQYYFLTLEDTSKRDRDQVVYRGTRAGNSFHNKNTRVVMVDQLWLWILDNRKKSPAHVSHNYKILTRIWVKTP